jgi:predicted transcriptional regulator
MPYLRFVVLIDVNKILFTAEILIVIYRLNFEIEKYKLSRKSKSIKQQQQQQK